MSSDSYFTGLFEVFDLMPLIGPIEWSVADNN